MRRGNLEDTRAGQGASFLGLPMSWQSNLLHFMLFIHKIVVHVIVRFCMGNDLKIRIIQAPGNWIGAGRGLAFLLSPHWSSSCAWGGRERGEKGLEEAAGVGWLPSHFPTLPAGTVPRREWPRKTLPRGFFKTALFRLGLGHRLTHVQGNSTPSQAKPRPLPHPRLHAEGWPEVPASFEGEWAHRNIYKSPRGWVPSCSGTVKGFGMGGAPWSPTAPGPCGLGMGPGRGWDGRNWQRGLLWSLKDPPKGPAWCKTLPGAEGSEGKALLLTCYVKGQDPGSPASQLGRRRLNMKDPPGGREGSLILLGPL